MKRCDLGTSQGIIWNPGGSLGIGITWQLLDGGIYTAQSPDRKALAQQQRDLAQQTRLDISQQIKTADAVYSNQWLALEKSIEAVQSALKAPVAAQASYRTLPPWCRHQTSMAVPCSAWPMPR